jgi:hypothetical protein
MLEKYSCYEFEIVGKNIDEVTAQYHYIIYLTPNYVGGNEAIESNEWYESEGEARLAAIGHITLLENGEG